MRHDALITPTALVASLAVGVAAASALGAGDADAWSGPLVIASLVLVASGAAKLDTPSSATAALAAVGLPRSAWLVRLVGAGEVALGTAAVLAGGRLAAAGVAAAYLVFAVVAHRMSSDPTVASCGCFGSAGARPGPLHVGVDVVAAALAAVALARGSGGIVSVVRDTPAGGVPALAGVLLGAAGVIALLTTAADALDAAAGARTKPASFHLVEDRR